ncbi:MAG: helix-turn-helix transcriptional regulator [Clostridia bacterium]|nr:helix-turn-helix transcriptional regulator [Clostridia bacterium]
MDMTKMGAFLQELRREQGLTQEQLGERLHVSSKTISRWETGAYMPPVEMLLALSELYGVSMNELVTGARIPPENLPQAAEQTLTAMLADQEAFQLNERKRFWQEKWLHDHRWSIALLVGVLMGVTIFFAFIRRTDLVTIIALLAIGLTIFLRNRRDGYVEHHLYDDQLSP